MFEPIVCISEMEAYLRRHIKVSNPEYVQYCNAIVGCRIEEKSDDAQSWKEAYVVSFDKSGGTHALLYESPMNSSPLKSVNLIMRTYRVITARCERNIRAMQAEQYALTAPKPKKKAGWSLFGSKPDKKDDVGGRVAGLCGYNKWFPATIVDSDKTTVTLVYDYGCGSEKLPRTRTLRLESPAVEGSADVQWQYLDEVSGWVDFDTQASLKLEFAITNGSHGTGIARGLSLLIVDFRQMTVREQSTGVDKRIRRTTTHDFWSSLVMPGDGRSEPRPFQDWHTEEEEGHAAVVSKDLPVPPSIKIDLHLVRVQDDSAEGVAIAAPNKSITLPSDMTLFQAIMRFLELPVGSMPWTCTYVISYGTRVELHQDEEGAPQPETELEPGLPPAPALAPQPEPELQLEPESALTAAALEAQLSGLLKMAALYAQQNDVPALTEVSAAAAKLAPRDARVVQLEALVRKSKQAVEATQVVVVYENQRCPWSAFTDPADETFSAAALLGTDRAPWSDVSGEALVDPRADPPPPPSWCDLRHSNAPCQLNLSLLPIKVDGGVRVLRDAGSTPTTRGTSRAAGSTRGTGAQPRGRARSARTSVGRAGCGDGGGSAASGGWRRRPSRRRQLHQRRSRSGAPRARRRRRRRRR
eukprot:SAG11_NODE_2384_length_3423_cov_3.062876_1_plen_639_part_10